MKKESKDRNWIAWIALGLSVIAIIVSVIAICIACPHVPELGFDYQGIIVGILALLVTMLIGWNIFSIIDIRKIRDELLTTKVSSVFNAEKNNAIT